MRKYFCDMCGEEMTSTSIREVEWQYRIKGENKNWYTLYADLCFKCISVFKCRVGSLERKCYK